MLNNSLRLKCSHVFLDVSTLASSSTLILWFLSFRLAKVSSVNRFLNLSELVPWDEVEYDYAAQFCKGFGLPPKLFCMVLGCADHQCLPRVFL